MRVPLAQQAQESLGKSDLVIITERVDDVALLIGQMVKMGLPEVLDKHIPRHGKQRGISWGRCATSTMGMECAVAKEMKEGPSQSACRGRLQTTSSCCGQKPRWCAWRKRPTGYVRCGSRRGALSEPTYASKICRRCRTWGLDPTPRAVEGKPVYCLEGTRCPVGTRVILALW